MEIPPVRLEVVAGNASGMSIMVEEQLVIGRHADGAGQLAADEELSRSHAMITRDSSGFVAIEDLGSTNGTFVNGLRINGPQTLSEGDSIELGATTLVVRELPPMEPLGSLAVGVNAAQDSSQPTVVPTVVPEPKPSEPAPEASEAPQALAPAEGEMPSTLAVRLEVDFAAREARILLDASEPVLLRFDGAEWRAGTSS
jgi:pSer/pThr/pTyr-binding forkhead associated (FHA) protein